MGLSLSLMPCPQPLVQIKQLKAERGIQALYSILLPRPEEEWREDPPVPTGCGDGKTREGLRTALWETVLALAQRLLGEVVVKIFARHRKWIRGGA